MASFLESLVIDKLVSVGFALCCCHIGVGSGFTLRTTDEASLDLITLYTATRSERQRRSAEERASQSRLMVATPGQPAVSELHPAVKELCKTLDGFVYVVDSTEAADQSLYLQPFLRSRPIKAEDAIYQFFPVQFTSLVYQL